MQFLYIYQVFQKYAEKVKRVKKIIKYIKNMCCRDMRFADKYLELFGILYDSIEIISSKCRQ